MKKFVITEQCCLTGATWEESYGKDPSMPQGDKRTVVLIFM